MAYTRTERCSCGAEISLSTDLSKTKDPSPAQIDSQVKDWRTRHKHETHSPVTKLVQQWTSTPVDAD